VQTKSQKYGWGAIQFPTAPRTDGNTALAEVPRPAAITSMEEAAATFLHARKLGGLTGTTQASYRNALGTFAAVAEHWPLTESDVQRWRETSERYHPATVQNRLIIFRIFWRWMRKHKFITADDPSEWLGNIKVPQMDPRIPTREDVLLLIKYCPATQPGRRLETIIRVLIDTGLRISELTGIRLQDVNFTAQTIKVFGKGQKMRTVWFGRNTYRSLQKWIESLEQPAPMDYLFATRTGGRMMPQWIVYELRRLSKRAGLSWPVSPHKLRHYFATEFLRREKNLEALRQILGHTNLKTTLRYLHLSGVDIGDAHHRGSPGDWLDR
jgi:site-specific recombinase XerD